MPASSADRWPVIRELYESGVPVGHLSTVASLTSGAILRRASGEGWTAPDEEDAARLRRIREAQERIHAEVDAAMAIGEGLDKSRIETAASAMKILERLLESERSVQLARQQAERARQVEREATLRARTEATREEDAESARESQERRDAETAEILQAIEEQIVMLAKDYAKELVADQRGSAKTRVGRA